MMCFLTAVFSHEAKECVEMCGLTSESVSPQEGRVEGNQLNHSSEVEASTQCGILRQAELDSASTGYLCMSWRHAVAPTMPHRNNAVRWPVRIVSENLRCPRVSLTRNGIRNSHFGKFLLTRRRRASGNAGISYLYRGISSTCSFWSKISETLADCASSQRFNHLTQTQKPLCAAGKSVPIGNLVGIFLWVTSSGWVTC